MRSDIRHPRDERKLIDEHTHQPTSNYLILPQLIRQILASMEAARRAVKRFTSGPALPLEKEESRSKRKHTLASRLEFFRRPLRLKGNSTISVPLGVVLLFPCIVVVFILFLFASHPASPVRNMMPAGTPPSIKYVVRLTYPSDKKLTRTAGKLVRSTTKFSRSDVVPRTRASRERMQYLSCWHGIRS